MERKSSELALIIGVYLLLVATSCLQRHAHVTGFDADMKAFAGVLHKKERKGNAPSFSSPTQLEISIYFCATVFLLEFVETEYPFLSSFESSLARESAVLSG